MRFAAFRCPEPMSFIIDMSLAPIRTKSDMQSALLPNLLSGSRSSSESLRKTSALILSVATRRSSNHWRSASGESAPLGCSPSPSAMTRPRCVRGSV
jgi:hypothetical protein